ncbi:MAG: hypothetical protein HYX69_03375 [Planctomycetia bacterium]|nr:hypothetical protein [Planctomycetia bacterium]
MFSRWYTVAVLFFWLATMGWLVKQKILPPMLIGEPPSYRTILESDAESEPVAWEIFLNGRRLGTAASRTFRKPDGMGEIRSRVVLDELPLSELTPVWISAFVKLLDDRHRNSQTIISIVADGAIEVEPLGRPIGFSSVTELGPPKNDVLHRSVLSGMHLGISMKGRVDRDTLHVLVQSGDFVFQTHLDLPADALMADALSPPTRLPGLRVGQTWTVPIYSPFLPPNAPLEVLHATVERKDPIVWQDRIVPALLVVYRGDPGLGLSSNQSARAQVWVDPKGQVVKQELWLASSRLLFVRLDPERRIDPELLPSAEAELRLIPSNGRDDRDGAEAAADEDRE